ncbi:glycosyltransferase family 2 protein [bacterium]|nr:glycosyltransferase family 2 protein [bacterium]
MLDNHCHCRGNSAFRAREGNIRFSIIIPYFSHFEVLSDYLDTLQEQSFSDFEVIIVNDGEQSMPQKYSKLSVTYLNNKLNSGYSASLNNGAAIAKGEWLILSNTDILLQCNALKDLDRLIRNRDSQMIQPLLIDRKGIPDPFSARALPPSWGFLYWPFRSQNFNFPVKYLLKRTSGGSINCAKGAFLAIKKDIFIELGGMDEQFWMFWEDVDLSKRLTANGYSIYFAPSLRITHLGSQTIRHISVKADLGEIDSRAGYFRKHHRIPVFLTVFFELKGAMLRYFTALFLGKPSAKNYYPDYLRGLKARLFRC